MADSNNGNQTDKINPWLGCPLNSTICLGFFLQWAMTSTFPTTIPSFVSNQTDKINPWLGCPLNSTICLGFFLQWAMTSTFPTTIPSFVKFKNQRRGSIKKKTKKQKKTTKITISAFLGKLKFLKQMFVGANYSGFQSWHR